MRSIIVINWCLLATAIQFDTFNTKIITLLISLPITILIFNDAKDYDLFSGIFYFRILHTLPFFIIAAKLDPF